MRTVLIFLLFWCSVASKAQSVSFGSLQVVTSGGDTISMHDFQGKKVLVVNSASISPGVNQLGSLEQLYQQLKDSGLVVIVCPSNSFGNEPGSDDEIRQFIANRFNAHFIITKRVEVTGENAHDLYKWIGSKTQNGVMNGVVQGDFSKFLIDGQGQIKGFYSGAIDPTNPVILGAIRNN